MTHKLRLEIAPIIFLVILLVCLILSGCGINSTLNSNDLEPNVLIKYVYYEIRGTTENDLRNQMDQLGPSDGRRIQHDAYTDWHVDWYYPNLEANGNCSTGLVSVTVTITHTLPKWDIPAEASQALVKKWNAYLEVLQNHEDGHKQIGIDAGYKILETLNNVAAFPSCVELEQIADTKGQNILDEFREKEVVYDQTTRHGESQNARFP